MIRTTQARSASRRRRVAAVGATGLLASLIAGGVGANAQLLPILPPPTTTTTLPGDTTTTAPPLLAGLLPPPTTTTTAPPAPAPADSASTPTGSGVDEGEGTTPPASAGAFPADLAAMTASVRRTPAKNTRALLGALDALVELGVPVEEARRVGMGRFPVAGEANYSHDWWFPRFGPGWRLHMGTDIFAAKGTPVRAPADGTVRLGQGGLGGITAYVVESNGTYYYLAHLDGYAPGMTEGQAVSRGDTVGYVGNTGNAAGGAFHLHFELHPAPTRTVTKGKGKKRTTQVFTVPVRPGTTLPAADPKAWLDQSLADAVADVPRLVAEYQGNPALLPAAAGAVDVATPEAPVVDGADSAQALASGTGLVSTRRPISEVPLAALAALLIVLVASLTPVFAPRKILLAPETAAPGRPAITMTSVDLAPPAEADAGRRGRRRRSRSSDRPRRRLRAAKASESGGAATSD